VAHQWWGNVVVPAGYQDEWILEGLANYSALMWLEKKKGPKVLEQLLQQYRDDLVAKDETGKTVESAGPITWGYRIESAVSPNDWRLITYEKGAWIFHMLRRRLGDERFLKMLAELRRRYEFKVVATEDLRGLVKEYLPPKTSKSDADLFFDNWVYSTGVPSLKLSYEVKGAAPQWRLSGTIEQTGVENDFTAEVPVEIQFAKSPPQTVWVETADEPATFSAALKEPPVKVTLGAGTSVLAAKK
jgi:aminopeptidase N